MNPQFTSHGHLAELDFYFCLLFGLSCLPCFSENERETRVDRML